MHTHTHTLTHPCPQRSLFWKGLAPPLANTSSSFRVQPRCFLLQEALQASQAGLEAPLDSHSVSSSHTPCVQQHQEFPAGTWLQAGPTALSQIQKRIQPELREAHSSSAKAALPSPRACLPHSVLALGRSQSSQVCPCRGALPAPNPACSLRAAHPCWPVLAGETGSAHRGYTCLPLTPMLAFPAVQCGRKLQCEVRAGHRPDLRQDLSLSGWPKGTSA